MLLPIGLSCWRHYEVRRRSANEGGACQPMCDWFLGSCIINCTSMCGSLHGKIGIRSGLCSGRAAEVEASLAGRSEACTAAGCSSEAARGGRRVDMDELTVTYVQPRGVELVMSNHVAHIPQQTS